MKCSASLLTLFALFAASSVARADTIFNVQGIFADGAALSGTLDYNGATFDGAQLTVKDGPITSNFNGVLVSHIFGDYNLYSLDLGGALSLYLPVTSLQNYAGSTLCSTSNHCGLLVSTFDAFDPLQSGSILPLTATPEPSSVMLMGTGLLGMAGMMRRRFKRA